MVNIAIFASGSGTNTQRIIEYFKTHKQIHVALVLSNNSDAYVLKRAEAAAIPAIVFSGKELRDVVRVKNDLEQYHIDFIVLAGFLLMIPAELIRLYPSRIINIHPALLPKYGGKGMFGGHVHEAVIRNHEKESGITIHYVNERYDEGAIIEQVKCIVDPDDTPLTLAEKIHALEYEYFPKIIEDTVSREFNLGNL
jgi:phosphoribosylglycinamide formyltransferase 1